MERQAKVYMPRSCYNRIVGHIYINPDYECGGFLIGDRVDDGDFIFSVRDIYYEPLSGERASFEFSLDYCSRAMDYADGYNERTGRNDYLAGTYHSHGTFDAFISGVDEAFARRYPLLLVFSPATKRIVARYLYLEEGGYKWANAELIVYPDEEKGEKRRKLYREDFKYKNGGEFFSARIYRKTTKKLAPAKKVLIAGCGTLGNLLARQFAADGAAVEITFLDREAYETANLPRSPMIESDAVGEPKAYALAEAYARASQSLQPARGIIGDARKFGIDFYGQFDVIVTPLDNLECRYYIAYCAYVLNKPLVNLGTSYSGTDGKPCFSGDVFYRPRDGKACLDCFYPLYKSSEKLLKKRVSCGGELPAEVSPQVISSSDMAACTAFSYIKRALAGEKCGQSFGVNINDVVKSETLFSAYPVKPFGGCAFSVLHGYSGEIKTVTATMNTPLASLAKRLDAAFKVSGGEYDIDITASCLTIIKYRSRNPINSIHVAADCTGKLKHIIKDGYFPRDYVYVVRAADGDRLVRIVIK